MRKGKPTLCDKCGFEISSFYFKQHHRVCDGRGPVSQRPKKGKFVPCGWNKGLNKETSEGVAKQAEALKGKKRDISPWDFMDEETKALLKKKLAERLIREGMVGYKHGVGRGRKGTYQGFKCDSAWELAWVIYNLDHGIPFIRSERVFLYLDPTGKERKYHPDFELEDGTLIEIKGWMSALDKMKLACLEGLPHRILQKKEMQEILNYVARKHGQRFWSVYDAPE